MRLGDLDALYEEVADHVTSVSVCATAQQAIGQTDFKRRCLEDIRNAPTIDAIPVEWLEQIKRECAADVQQVPMFVAIGWLVDMWQKEQEAERLGIEQKEGT